MESTDSPQGGAESAPPSPEPTQEPKLSVRQLFDRHVLGRRGPDERAEASRADAGGEDEPKAEPDKPQRQEPAAKREVSEEELARLVQAETDRRETKRQREQQELDRKRLRDEDPEAYTRQEKDAEALEQQLGLTAQIFDEALLNPVMLALEEKDRAEIVAGGIQGLEGRTAAIGKAIDRIRATEFERGKAEGMKAGEEKARKNPALVKAALVGVREETTDEPELVAAGSAPAPRADGNAFIRGLYRASRS